IKPSLQCLTGVSDNLTKPLRVLSMGADQAKSRPTLMRTLAALGLMCGITAPLSAEQVLPHNLPSLPVLIQIPVPNATHYGTGIFLTDSQSVFLVTAAHVIFNPESTNKTQLNGPEATLFAYSSATGATERNVL